MRSFAQLTISIGWFARLRHGRSANGALCKSSKSGVEIKSLIERTGIKRGCIGERRLTSEQASLPPKSQHSDRILKAFVQIRQKWQQISRKDHIAVKLSSNLLRKTNSPFRRGGCLRQSGWGLRNASRL
jgi:hypothetical protein